MTVQRNEALNDISDWRAKCVDVQSSRSGIETEYGKLQAQVNILSQHSLLLKDPSVGTFLANSVGNTGHF